MAEGNNMLLGILAVILGILVIAFPLLSIFHSKCSGWIRYYVTWNLATGTEFWNMGRKQKQQV